MPTAQLLAGIALLVVLAITFEVAETISRVARMDLRSGGLEADRELDAGNSAAQRFGGLAVAAGLVWFYALPWVAGSGLPAGALLLVLGACAVGALLLGRIKHAAVRYPAAATAPVLLVAAATSLV